MTDKGQVCACVLLAALLAGCGLKGDLYLPDEEDNQPEVAAPAGGEAEAAEPAGDEATSQPGAGIEQTDTVPAAQEDDEGTDKEPTDDEPAAP